MSGGLTFPSRVPSTDESRAWTVIPTSHSWFSWHKSWDVNWFSKQCAITLVFSFGWHVIPNGPWTAVWTLWCIPLPKQFCSRPQSLRCDLTVPYFCFPPFECLSTSSRSNSQSRSYFTNGSLPPPISSSWRQVPWDPQPNIFIFNWTPALIDLV
jgi:hypothetical protein